MDTTHCRLVTPLLRTAFGSLAIALGVTAAAHAADLGPSRDEAPATGPGYIVTIGGMLTYSPEYRGADSNSFGGLPSLSWRREGAPKEFSAPDDGLDFSLIDTPRFKAGPVGSLSNGRSEKDDHRLIGLDNYDTAIEAGVFAEYWWLPNTLRTRMELRYGFRDDDGFTMDIGADFVRRFGAMTLSAGPRMTFSDGDRMNLQYGVSTAAATRTGLSAFNAGGGLESVGATIALSYDLTRDVTLTVYDRYDHLVGDASDSPITRAFGSDGQNTVGIGLTYSFHTGK